MFFFVSVFFSFVVYIYCRRVKTEHSYFIFSSLASGQLYRPVYLMSIDDTAFYFIDGFVSCLDMFGSQPVRFI